MTFLVCLVPPPIILAAAEGFFVFFSPATRRDSHYDAFTSNFSVSIFLDEEWVAKITSQLQTKTNVTLH